MRRLARCPNSNCRSHDVSRKRAGDGQGSMDSCAHCGSTWPSVPGTTLASRANKKRRPAVVKMSTDAYYLSADADEGRPVPLGLEGYPVKVKVKVGGEDKEFPVAYLWKDAIAAGAYVHPKTGRKLEVDAARIDGWVERFKAMRAAGIEIPAPAGHSSHAEANRGFVIDAKREGDRLKTLVQVYGEDGALLAARNRCSLCIEPDYVDERGRHWGDTFTHLAFTPTPVVSGMGEFESAQDLPFAASRDGATADVYYLASDGDCRWVTIEGAHVCIGGNGKITKGPAHLVGKTVASHTESAIRAEAEMIQKEHKAQTGEELPTRKAIDAARKGKGIETPAMKAKRLRSLGIKPLGDEPIRNAASRGYENTLSSINGPVHHSIIESLAQDAATVGMDPNDVYHDLLNHGISEDSAESAIRWAYRRTFQFHFTKPSLHSVTLSRSTAMQLSEEQLAAVRSETGMADLTDDDAGFTRIIDYIHTAKGAKDTAEQKAVNLSRDLEAAHKPRAIDPDILLDRADVRCERIDNLLASGHISTPQADALRKAVKPDGKPSAVMLSRDADVQEFPIDTMLKVLKMGKGGVEAGDHAKDPRFAASRPEYPATADGKPDDKKLADEGFAEGADYQKRQLQARGLQPLT